MCVRLCVVWQLKKRQKIAEILREMHRESEAKLLAREHQKLVDEEEDRRLVRECQEKLDRQETRIQMSMIL